MELPKALLITDDYEIGEQLNESTIRILLSPSKCYRNDEIVCLEDVIKAIVQRYNGRDDLLAALTKIAVFARDDDGGENIEPIANIAKQALTPKPPV